MFIFYSGELPRSVPVLSTGEVDLQIEPSFRELAGRALAGERSLLRHHLRFGLCFPEVTAAPRPRFWKLAEQQVDWDGQAIWVERVCWVDTLGDSPRLQPLYLWTRRRGPDGRTGRVCHLYTEGLHLFLLHFFGFPDALTSPSMMLFQLLWAEMSLGQPTPGTGEWRSRLDATLQQGPPLVLPFLADAEELRREAVGLLQSLPALTAGAQLGQLNRWLTPVLPPDPLGHYALEGMALPWRELLQRWHPASPFDIAPPQALTIPEDVAVEYSPPDLRTLAGALLRIRATDLQLVFTRARSDWTGMAPGSWWYDRYQEIREPATLTGELQAVFAALPLLEIGSAVASVTVEKTWGEEALLTYRLADGTPVLVQHLDLVLYTLGGLGVCRPGTRGNHTTAAHHPGRSWPAAS